jgi:hypothetical protein
MRRRPQRAVYGLISNVIAPLPHFVDKGDKGVPHFVVVPKQPPEPTKMFTIKYLNYFNRYHARMVLFDR